MKQRTVLALIIFIQVFSISLFSQVRETNLFSYEYRNLRFWDIDLGQCFYPQETDLSCVPASVQMVLRYFDYSLLPNQTQLATEMHTNLNSPTQWQYIYIPFQKRGFRELYNQSLSNDFNVALSHLKANLSQNFPAIVNTWYSEEAKADGKITHARVVTGYNSTGIFVHDPLKGPNQFMDYGTFSSLWKTDSGYWAFIVKQEPKFDIVIQAEDWFGNPISGVEFFLQGKINRTEVTNLNGTATFSGLTLANYILSYSWRFESGRYSITLTRTRQKSYLFLLSNQTILIITGLITVTGVILWILKSRRR